jgi:hypothetical protein
MKITKTILTMLLQFKIADIELLNPKVNINKIEKLVIDINVVYTLHINDLPSNLIVTKYILVIDPKIKLI